MRGHIRKRGSTWTIVFYVDVNGEKKQKWIGGFKTKKEAEAALAEYIQRNSFSKDITFGEFLDEWVKQYCESRLAPRTLRRYTEIIRLYIKPKLGSIKMKDLSPFKLQQYYTWLMNEGDGLALSPATVLYHHRIIHKALEQAIKWEITIRNPADAVEPPSVKRKEAKTLNEDQAAELINYLYKENHVLFIPTILAMSTGMRRGEICGLQWEDINFDKAFISIKHQLQRVEGELKLRETKTPGSRRPSMIYGTLMQLLCLKKE
ncbi:site-specific integrase [Thermovorax subterraneus]|nr:site-specific integrase [Thermovorax subterraneus]